MNEFYLENKNKIKMSAFAAFMIFNTLIWIFASDVNLFQSRWTVKLVVLIVSELLWSLSLLFFTLRYDLRLTIFLNIVPVVLALFSLFPLVLTILFIILGFTNIIILLPSFKMDNYYGLVSFSFVNALVPVISICYLNNLYLQMNVVINFGILFCLYFLFFVVYFNHRLESIPNVVFIIIFTGLTLANLSVLRCILLIVLVLISYGIQIFNDWENPYFSMFSFIVVGLLSFI